MTPVQLGKSLGSESDSVIVESLLAGYGISKLSVFLLGLVGCFEWHGMARERLLDMMLTMINEHYWLEVAGEKDNRAWLLAPSLLVQLMDKMGWEEANGRRCTVHTG